MQSERWRSMDATPFTLRVRLVFHPTGVTIKVASHGREIGAVPLEPRDKPLVLPMRSALSGTTDAPFGRY